jgi:hypothetical protein
MGQFRTESSTFYALVMEIFEKSGSSGLALERPRLGKQLR